MAATFTLPPAAPTGPRLRRPRSRVRPVDREGRTRTPVLPPPSNRRSSLARSLLAACRPCRSQAASRGFRARRSLYSLVFPVPYEIAADYSPDRTVRFLSGAADPPAPGSRRGPSTGSGNHSAAIARLWHPSRAPCRIRARTHRRAEPEGYPRVAASSLLLTIQIRKLSDS